MSTPSDEDSVGPDRGGGGEEEEEEEELVVGQGSKKPLKGKVWKSSVSGDYVRYRSDGCGTDYCPGDAVYIESRRPEQPYYVCAIQSLKMSKRDSLMVHVKWFYRISEVPEQVYQLLVQDRHTEHGSQKYDVIHDPMTRKRELFISDATDIYPVSVLRGKCTVYHCLDIKSFRNFLPEKDTFFYTLSYNPETRRMASMQGEIRVGASHQAKLPELETLSDVSLIPEPKADPAWEPGRIHDHDLLMYLRASRSMAAFAAMCDGGSTEDGFATASRDSITANAVRQLHEVDYDTGKALQSLLKVPNPPDLAREWREEDIKDFIKGLRIYGKNFFKIRTEFFPQKETSDLINFYYLWKKSPGAVNNRPRGRRHRPNIVRRIKSSKAAASAAAASSTKSSSKDDPTDLSSASEGEAPGAEEEDKELSPYYCRHCYSTSSKDWHHASKEKILVCRECRMYFKKYGELPTLDPRKEMQEDELLPDVLEADALKKEEETTNNIGSAVATNNIPPEETSIVKKEEETPAVSSDSPKKEVEEEEEKSGETKDNNSSSSCTLETKPTTEVEDKPRLFPKVAEDLSAAIEQDSKPPPSSPSHPPPRHPEPLPPHSAISHSISSVLPPSTTSSSGMSPRFPPLHQPHLSPLHPPSRPSLPFGAGLGLYNPPPSDLQKSLLGSMFSPLAHGRPPPPHHGMHPLAAFNPPSYPNNNKDPEVQILHHSRSTPTPPPPREPSPPPKPDGSECHRSQSAIFIRNWNRGEGNSCSRTDMYFKPVPESKLARKRDERLRKASNSCNEDLPSAAKMSSLPPGFSHVPSDPFHPPPVMSRASPHPASPLATSFKLQELERYERERKEEFLRMSMAGRHPPPMDPFAPDPRRFIQPGNNPDMARAERQYIERITALATDPLVRLQMAGVNPELPPGHHPGFLHPPGPRMHPGELLGSLGRYPPPPHPHGHHPELLQRQLLLERELLAAHGAAAAQHQSLLAQQEEFLRLEQEARARQSRP